jgi:hypothetical protein
MLVHQLACTDRYVCSRIKAALHENSNLISFVCHTKPVLYCLMQANGDYFTQLPKNIKYRCLAACYIWETVLPSTSCCWSSFGNHKAFFIVKEMHCGIRTEMLSQLCVRADALLCFCRLDLRLVTHQQL